MFKSARIKLTLWYLLIIMIVSMVFSVVIYATITRELERGFRQAEMRLRIEELPSSPFHLQPRRLGELNPQLIEDLEAAKKRVIFNLLITNSVILAISALAGYLLAGKTLRPIEIAMDEQKRFIADASHELRTPLTALKTSMEVTLRDKKMSLLEAKKVIRDSLKDIDGLQSLSDNLLSLANLQSNGQNLVFAPVEVTAIVKNACRKIMPLANKKKIDLKTKVVKQTIFAQKEILEEMMLIFLDNAVKFTPQKGIITVKTQTGKNYLLLIIKDTGTGIDQKDIPHIFDRFYRADKSRSKREVSGYGLGLSLAKRIIEIHKGTVSVTSNLNQGATFTIKLPLKLS